MPVTFCLLPFLEACLDFLAETSGESESAENGQTCASMLR
jgi:hypothetical protein